MKLFLTQPGTYSHEFTRNFDRVRRLVQPLRSQFEPKDILVLPELVGGESGTAEYDNFTSDLATGLGCYVVAGSHHE